MTIFGKITERRVIAIYNNLKHNAREAYDMNDYEQAALMIERAANWAYRYNFQFSDRELDMMIVQLSQKVGPKRVFTPVRGRLAFVCSRMSDNGELTRQYVQAIIDNKIPTLMLVIDTRPEDYTVLLQMIKACNNIKLQMIVPQISYLNTAKFIANEIVKFQPEWILQHFIPWEVKCLMGIALISNTPRYNINFNDHAFWLGASLLDFNIEFRSYGATISKEKRGLAARQLLHLRYYSVIDENIHYEGLPFDSTGKIVLFSGGNYYKMVDSGNTYFRVLDRILKENTNALAVIASNSRALKYNISRMSNRHRIYILPYRKDIWQLMRHIDIYYGTFPLSGGLMSMYAALASKPGLFYAPIPYRLDEVDGLLNDNTTLPYSFDNIDKLCKYACKLCSDKEYRMKEGNKIHSTAQTRKRFSSQFAELIKGEKKCCSIDCRIDYEGIFKSYINFNNIHPVGTVLFVFKCYGILSLFKFPYLATVMLSFLFKRAVNNCLYRIQYGFVFERIKNE